MLIAPRPDLTFPFYIREVSQGPICSGLWFLDLLGTPLKHPPTSVRGRVVGSGQLCFLTWIAFCKTPEFIREVQLKLPLYIF